MIESILKFVGDHLQELLTFLLAALVAVILNVIRGLPDALERFGHHLEDEAKKTPGGTDDVAAFIVVAIARALKAAFAKNGVARGFTTFTVMLGYVAVAIVLTVIVAGFYFAGTA